MSMPAPWRWTEGETIVTECDAIMMAILDHSFTVHSLQLYFESAPGMANRFDIEVRSGDKNPRVVASCAAMAPGSDHKVSRGEISE